MKKPHMLHHHHTTAPYTTNQILLNKITLFASSFGKHNFLYYTYNVIFFHMDAKILPQNKNNYLTMRK